MTAIAREPLNVAQERRRALPRAANSATVAPVCGLCPLRADTPGESLTTDAEPLA